MNNGSEVLSREERRRFTIYILIGMIFLELIDRDKR